MIALTHERLLTVIAYNPISGKFSRGGTIEKVGCEWKGPRSKTKYLKISIDGYQFYAHRLAWFYIYGAWPAEIDHINGDGLDNRLSNLRQATRAQNCTNSPAQKSSKIGFRGVHFHYGARRYRAQITKAGKTKHIGYFNTPEEAYAAYLAKARELHGEFVREPSCPNQ